MSIAVVPVIGSPCSTFAKPSRAWLEQQLAHASPSGKLTLMTHPTVFAKEPDVNVITRVSGPEPGYIATSIIIVQCGLTLLEERDSCPAKGGIFTVGTLLGYTNIIERLHRAGIIFEVVSVSIKQAGGGYEHVLRQPSM